MRGEDDVIGIHAGAWYFAFPADWYLVVFPLLTVLTEILRCVETLQRVSKSAEVGPRRTMVSFIGMLTLVHPFATTWHFSTGKHVTGFAGRGAPL